ncbi:hypothetical protein [Xanthomonas phaseoli]|uniref:hypothetical protein n=1 Tax=Xanthomonas phaseoli TaxID=1985254 RepID=UPI0005286525|nr:hypothetical protein [Xanthomonas phaseoli]
MSTSHYTPIPSTAAMLVKLKKPKKAPTIFNKIEQGLFVATLVLACIMFLGAGVGVAGWIPRDDARLFAMVMLILVAVTFLLWAVTQILRVILDIRAGFGPIAERTDGEVEQELAFVQGLTQCDPSKLKERSKLLEGKAKRLTRQAGMGTVIATIGAVVINFQTSAERAEMLVQLRNLPLFVYSGSLGALLGAAALTVFAGKLEHIAGLLALAADRVDRK